MLTLWRPSAASMERAKRAPLSAVLPSYEQEQHLRALPAPASSGTRRWRGCLSSWEKPGRCDPRAMTHVVTAHLRRHDTYRSWFEQRGGAIVRHTLTRSPRPSRWSLWRSVRFARRIGGNTSRAHSCTVCVGLLSIWHSPAREWVHILRKHRPFARRCDRHRVPDDRDPLGLSRRARRRGPFSSDCRETIWITAAISAGRQPRRRWRILKVTRWIAFFTATAGGCPLSRLPLGVLEDRYHAGVRACMTSSKMPPWTTFEAACHACWRASDRRSVGLRGADRAGNWQDRSRYSVVTPTTTRRSPKAFRTTGWCVGVVPIDFDVQQRDVS